MICRHCGTAIHYEEKTQYLGKDTDGHWWMTGTLCPECERLNLFLVKAKTYSVIQPEDRLVPEDTVTLLPVYPRGTGRPPCPSEVPNHVAEDYVEACLVLPDSAKASAALSRRCLQNLLRDCAGVQPTRLVDEIQQAIGGGLPSHLADMVDAVRHIGNFAAHPTKSQNTGEILPVEPQEAEWNLDVLEALFDFYCVQPARIAEKRAALNDKLEEAGRQPMR